MAVKRISQQDARASIAESFVSSYNQATLRTQILRLKPHEGIPQWRRTNGKGHIVADSTTYEVVSNMEIMPGRKHDPQFLVTKPTDPWVGLRTCPLNKQINTHSKLAAYYCLREEPSGGPRERHLPPLAEAGPLQGELQTLPAVVQRGAH